MLNQEQQIFEQIKKAKNILIAFNKNWDGDSVASALAVFLFLKKLNKNVELIAEEFEEETATALPAGNRIKYLSFLPSYASIKKTLGSARQLIINLNTSAAKAGQVKYVKQEKAIEFIITPQEGTFSIDDVTTRISEYKYDLIIVLDSADLESLGGIYEKNAELFYKTPVINIDNHPGNENFGQINYVDITAVATSEIIFSLLNSFYAETIDEDIATCLLAGMISKTRSFKTSNISPKSLSQAAQLISLGARREEIVNQLYRSRSLNTLKLWGRVLARLKTEAEGKLTWSTINKNDFLKTNTNENDLNEVVDELIVNMPRASLIALIYENEVSGTSALIYATKGLDALSLVKEFSPQGTKNIAKIILNKPYPEAENQIIAMLEEKLKKLTS